MSGQLPRFSHHRVRRGDTLWRLAEVAYGHGDLWPQISEANHLRPGAPLLIGQELRLPLVQHGSHSRTQRTSHGGLSTGAAPAAPRSSNFSAAHVSAQRAPAPAARRGQLDGPFQLARPVFFPKFKQEMKKVVAQYGGPNGEVKLTYTGEMTVQQEGVITGNLTFTKEGIEAEYKKNADGIFKDFFSKCTPKLHLPKEVEVELAVGAEMRVGNRVLATTEVAFAPPRGSKFTYKGEEAKFVYKGFEFAGVLGFEMEVQPGDNESGPELQPAHAMNWKKVAGITLGVGVIAVGVGILVADAVKDVGTGGAGLVETPLSFAAAMRLFATGTAMIGAVAH